MKFHKVIYYMVIILLISLLISFAGCYYPGLLEPPTTPEDSPVPTEAPAPTLPTSTPQIPDFMEFDIPTAGANVLSLDLAPDGSVWFTELFTHKIGHFNPDTEKFTEYSVPANYPRDIVYNTADNLVYFTCDEYGSGQYGVLNPATGDISLHPTGLAVASAVDCFLDTSGVFWFNGWDSQSLARGDAEGNVTSYTLPDFGYTSGLACDAGGNFWLTIVGAYETNPRLVRMNINHQFATYTLPRSPLTIRRPLAAFGRIWYLESEYSGGYTYNSSIGCYDPAGTIFESYALPAAGSGGTCLAADNMGLIWIGEEAANKLGALNPTTRTVVEYSLPTPACRICDIAIDTERGLLWYLAADANKLGRFFMP